MDRIEAMKAFVAVAEEGSFTKAANKLQSSNQLVSKYVSQLEQQLGGRLFNRTTRKVHLTEIGEQCFIQAKQIIESFTHMQESFGALQGSVNGHLKISAPVSFATLHLTHLLQEFKLRYPEVTIDLQLNDRKIDVVEEGYDVALRIGKLKSSSMIAKKVAPIKLVLCASPDYLAKYGTPATPSDLNPQHFLHYSYMEFGPSAQPLLERLRGSQFKRQSSFTSNNGEVLMAAAIAGQGYALQPTFIVGKALQQGQLVTFLSDYQPEPLGLYAVYPHRQLLAPKLRAFIDFISQYYGDTPYWDIDG